MSDDQIFHVNYYVAALLSQGGDLKLNDARILFTPTSPIDSAIFGNEVMIQLETIWAYEVVGGISRTVRIKAKDRIYKFEGSEAVAFGQALYKKIPKKLIRPESVVKPLHPIIGPQYSCEECTEVLKPGIKFCTRCGKPPRNACLNCRALLDTNWLYCGYCGHKVGNLSERIAL